MKQTLQNFKNKDFYDSAVALFEKLSIPLNKPTREPIDLSLLGEHKSLEHIHHAYLIGQVDDAIFEGKSLHVNLKEGKYEGLLLFGVTLKKSNPTRAELASISRTFNRAFKYLPVVILFYYGDKLSLSSTERSEYKISKEGEKVGKVSILRDISIQNPHAGHIKVLQALVRNTKIKTYDELYQHWQKTLNISIVTKEFYTKLFAFFTELQNTITYPSESQKEFFIITLLGRILFLRFLHAKGLIPDEKFEVKDEYYHLTLEPLFFEILNKPIEKRFVDFKEESIPFLNGGLFENTTSDYYKFSELARVSEYIGILKIPDTWFRALFELFDSYIFTVDENTSSDVEVALDPELLGRVFENLLASVNPETKESARKATGSYYTPREIVDYMVSSSLKEYLKTKTSIDETKLESLCFNKTCDFEPMEKTQILQAIFELKVLDPACGSGAFPMGLLNHLVAMLDAIDFKEDEWFSLQSKEFKEKHKNRDKNYIRKLSIIQNSIFGVDIQPIAIEISKLRFFLSLIVDESNDKIEPLPNMEFKFVCANTLLPLQKKGQMSLIASDYTHIEKELKRIKEAYFNTTDRDEKERLKKAFLDNLKALRHEIGLDFDNKIDTYNPFDVTSSAEFFDMDYMFGISKGFDIVIGNPPYIKEYSNKKAFDVIRENKRYYQGKMDIWYFFTCIGIDLLKENGILSFIAPNNWITNSGASKLRNKVLCDTKIIEFIDFGDFKVFESADIQTMVMNLQVTQDNNEYECIYLKLLDKDYPKHRIDDFLHKKQNQNFFISKTKIIKLGLNNKNISFSENKHTIILNKIEKSKNFELTELEVANGIHTHHSEVNKNMLKIDNSLIIKEGIFVINYEKKESLNLNSQEIELVKPLYTSEQVNRYIVNSENKLWIIYTNSSFKKIETIKPYPNIKKHLDRFSKVITSDNKPYGLHRARNENFFIGEKIASLRKCPDRPSFSYINFDCYLQAEYYLIKSNRINLKYLTAILNSKLIAYWLKHKGKMQGNNYQIDKEPILSIPIKRIETIQPFINLVDNILTCKTQNPKADTSELEAQIDTMVYALYGLNEEEIAIIEGK